MAAVLSLATLKYLDGKKYVQASDFINLLDTLLFFPPNLVSWGFTSKIAFLFNTAYIGYKPPKV